MSSIVLIEKNKQFFVSSREVAEKFQKDHHNVIKAIEKLQVPETFSRVNFDAGTYLDSQGQERKQYLMSKDGFCIIAFGFTGKEALAWKLKFLDAFNKMEATIRDTIPLLEEKIRILEARQPQLPAKKQHGNKNTVLVPVPESTLFGTDVVYHRVQRDDTRFSDASFAEGELKRMTSLMTGMIKKVNYLAKQVAILRRS